ncbi:hypothetical protein J6590_083195 [Homalodisca vitripennis]|nr:hypothetical protein J6590_083195 [Homalodisca vitripennis]
MWAREVVSNKTGCGSHTVTRTRLNTWRLRIVEWIRGLSLRSQKTTRCLPHCNADTAEYLETAECRVDPRFESPELEESTETSLYKKAGNKKITIKESLEVPLNKTECRSHIVTQTRQGTWRLRNVGWSRGLSLR